MPVSVPSTSSSSGTTSPASSPSGERRAEDAPRAVDPLTAFGRFVFRYRDALAPVVFAGVIVATYPVPFLGSRKADAVLDAVGLCVALAGQSLRVLVIGLAYIKRGGRKKEITADRLVAEGVFAHCRNPLYVGDFLLIAGLTMVWNSPPAYVVVLGFVGLALVSIVRAEEAFLVGRFGAEYAAYCARVSRFVPDLRGLRQTLADFDFDWRRVIRKEYGTACTWTSGALAMFVAERVAWDGWSAAGGALRDVLPVWLAVGALWVAARFLKKTRRLGSD
jgi:protein-S-isoprenylcysteine O-methyltransferase Ste14